MILGIGTDLANIDRIAGVLERHGDRFRNRVFTETELKKAARRKDEAGTLAKRWAAKEACSKALGTGFSHGVFMKDIGVVNDYAGKPSLILTGGALARLQSLVPPGMKPSLHLTLTDDPPMIQAHVIIEAL